MCVWWSQPLWLSSPHSLPPTPNHSLTFTRPNTHATRQIPPPHPISFRHGHHRAVSNNGCRQGGGSEAARTLPTTTLTNTQEWWWCVCERVPSGCCSPHHTHSRQLPTTPSHSPVRIRTPHARPSPLHPISCRHSHHRAVSNKGWACWPTTWWRQGGGRQLVGSEAVRTLPTTHTGVVVCVCVVVSASVALHTTLTPANSQPLPHIHAPEYARHTPDTAAASHFMPSWPPQDSNKQGLGMLCRPHGGGSVAAAWRQTAGWLRSGANTAHQHTGVVVCVCERVPSGCGSPHHTHSRQLPTTPSHSRARIRTPHASHHRCIPCSCRYGHHRAVSNKGWACWPTT